MNELSFPLEVDDMNMEVISYLDDDALYNLCKSSKNSKRLCSNPAVWSAQRPSQLAPLNFLLPFYSDWMEFYENVRNDYVYVTVHKDSQDFYIEVHAIITDAFHLVLRKLRTFQISNDLTTIEQLYYSNISQYLKPSESYEIGLARKNYIYTQGVFYDHLLYKVDSRATSVVNSLVSYPELLSPTMLIIGKQSSGMLISTVVDNDVYYCDYTDDNLMVIETKAYNALLIRTGDRKSADFFRLRGQRIFRCVLSSIKKIKYSGLFLVPPGLIDNYSTFMLVVMPVGVEISRAASAVDVLRMLEEYGTFYRAQDLLAFLE